MFREIVPTDSPTVFLYAISAPVVTTKLNEMFCIYYLNHIAVSNSL